MGALCAACRRAVLEADPRLVEALYLCQVQAAAEALSGVYAVLGRRRARILQVCQLVFVYVLVTRCPCVLLVFLASSCWLLLLLKSKLG